MSITEREFRLWRGAGAGAEKPDGIAAGGLADTPRGRSGSDHGAGSGTRQSWGGVRVLARSRRVGSLWSSTARSKNIGPRSGQTLERTAQSSARTIVFSALAGRSTFTRLKSRSPHAEER